FEDVVGRLKAYEARVKEEDKANDAKENLLYVNIEYSNRNNNTSKGRRRGSYSRGHIHGRDQGSEHDNTQNHGQRNSSKNHKDNDQRGNSQVKDNKIDLLVQQYEQEDESIDSAFARFNTTITSLKAPDEGYSSKNYVWKFLRVHPKWRAKVTKIEESKDLTSLSLDELIRNLKIHKMVIEKDFKIVKAKEERKSFALKAKKESSDEECLTSKSEDEEYAMVVRDFKKFFKRRGRCGDPNHLTGECPKPPKDKNQRAYVGGSWSDSGEEYDEKVNNKTCLVAQASSEVKETKKGQNRIKTGQKREAWRSQEKSKAVTVKKARKTEENTKRRVKNLQSLTKLYRRKKRQ
nr:serine/threonine protein kinase SRPK1 [Tanacetum cinerariifolium]